ncbi:MULTISPECIES: hypothetical protein [unclassified Rhizobium]|uniref:hypothetical protein n=1 Tax=unclassified Rhizobium TaxID=2613769 RepID=UPI000EA8C824|nr:MULTISPECIES: hypothetical protein [unclassified Rhizobium]AYG64928.1 hypothetical protein CCGE531_02190 [Rhizobium sp. CCGE531]AYG71413.1 hypothetical protein CCGE532_02180 [Rhizobium sp. CCGE532]
MKAATLAILLIATTAAGVSAAYPTVAAVACPNCLGFKKTQGQVYVEDGMAPQQQAAVLQTIAAARDRLRQFYGTIDGDPKIFVCGDDNCYRKIGGGKSRGMALLNLALFLSLQGTTVTIASHEMSHIELHTRIGLIKTFRRDVPQWFDEGVAVLVSDDSRYLRPTSSPDRCLVEPDGALPTSRSAWIESAASTSLYAKAACRVSKWIADHGGSPAVTQLLANVAAGQSFEMVY